MANIPDCMYDYRREEPVAKEFTTCYLCGTAILEGEEYYDIGGHEICMDCMDKYKKVGGED